MSEYRLCQLPDSAKAAALSITQSSSLLMLFLDRCAKRLPCSLAYRTVCRDDERTEGVGE